MTSSSSITAGKTTRYAPVAILLHWALAILIIGMIGLGWYMLSIEEEPGSGWYVDLHKSIGIIIAVLVLLRVVWRLGHQPQALPDSVPGWQATGSRMTHWLLYGAMIVMPIVGIAGALFSKNGITFFGLTMPRLFPPDHAVAEIFFSVHSVVAWGLVGLIAVHVLDALKHILINKDRVFQRMLLS